MFIDGGKPTTASYISGTLPLPADKPDIAVCTAMAGEMLGLRLMYLDAGSGAPILLVANAAARAEEEDPVGELLEDICLAKESFDEKNCELFGVILNRVDPDDHRRRE